MMVMSEQIPKIELTWFADDDGSPVAQVEALPDGDDESTVVDLTLRELEALLAKGQEVAVAMRWHTAIWALTDSYGLGKRHLLLKRHMGAHAKTLCGQTRDGHVLDGWTFQPVQTILPNQQPGHDVCRICWRLAQKQGRDR